MRRLAVAWQLPMFVHSYADGWELLTKEVLFPQGNTTLFC